MYWKWMAQMCWCCFILEIHSNKIHHLRRFLFKFLEVQKYSSIGTFSFPCSFVGFVINIEKKWITKPVFKGINMSQCIFLSLWKITWNIWHMLHTSNFSLLLFCLSISLCMGGITWRGENSSRETELCWNCLNHRTL